jgi:hypothetical protein
MFRIFSLLLALCITVSAQHKPVIYIDGGKGCNLSAHGNYDDLAAAIQKSNTSAERGTFWLALAKAKDGKIVAQTVGVKGKTTKLELAAIDAAENFKFSADFDLLMLRVNSDGVKANNVKAKKSVVHKTFVRRKVRA